MAQVTKCRGGEGVEARENGKEVHILFTYVHPNQPRQAPRPPTTQNMNGQTPKKKKKKKTPTLANKHIYNNGSIKLITNPLAKDEV